MVFKLHRIIGQERKIMRRMSCSLQQKISAHTDSANCQIACQNKPYRENNAVNSGHCIMSLVPPLIWVEIHSYPIRLKSVREMQNSKTNSILFLESGLNVRYITRWSETVQNLPRKCTAHKELYDTVHIQRDIFFPKWSDAKILMKFFFKLKQIS